MSALPNMAIVGLPGWSSTGLQAPMNRLSPTQANTILSGLIPRSDVPVMQKNIAVAKVMVNKDLLAVSVGVTKMQF